MRNKPSATILTGYGINCEEETAFAFEQAGADAHITHINELLADPDMLKDTHILAFPGGFSYGDDTGSGKALANQIRNMLGENLAKFIERDTLVLGICNGCQVLASLGLIPHTDDTLESTIALTHNQSALYEDRWVHLACNPESPCIFTQGMKTLFAPIAHGEGRFFATDEHITNLQANRQLPLTYTHPNGTPANGTFPHNPNGSLADVAGVCDPTGRIFGLMPHPERALFFTQRPDWGLERELLLRNGDNLPSWHEGFRIFQNAVQYFT